MSGTYAINNTVLQMQPTSGRWLERPILGINGVGMPVYPSSYNFEMRFNLPSQAEVYQLQNFFNGLGLTGTCVVDLPEYNSSTPQFHSYSGCVVYEPTRNTLFVDHTTDLVVIVSRIIV